LTLEPLRPLEQPPPRAGHRACPAGARRLLKRRTDDEWRVLPPVIPPFAEPGTKDQFLRGPGVADLVAALGGAPQRASAPLAYHVLETIQAIETSGRTAENVRLATQPARPAPVHAAARRPA
jgi:hypothetical protein